MTKFIIYTCGFPTKYQSEISLYCTLHTTFHIVDFKIKHSQMLQPVQANTNSRSCSFNQTQITNFRESGQLPRSVRKFKVHIHILFERANSFIIPVYTPFTNYIFKIKLCFIRLPISGQGVTQYTSVGQFWCLVNPATNSCWIMCKK